MAALLTKTKAKLAEVADALKQLEVDYLPASTGNRMREPERKRKKIDVRARSALEPAPALL